MGKRKKVCPRCQKNKDLDEFHRSNMTKDKRQAYCKVCNGECTPKQRRIDYNKRRQKRRQDPEYKQREYDLGRMYRINYREKYLLKGVKKRALENNLPFNLTVSDIVIPEKCPVLNTPLTKGNMIVGDWNAPSVDRIIPQLGYVKGNIIVVSRRVNTMKNNASLEELKLFCKNILKVIQKAQKIK